MRLHNLKIKECYMRDIWAKIKTFELRKNDRNFEVNDLVKFEVIEDDSLDILSLMKNWKNDCYRDVFPLIYRITYVLKDVPQYGLHYDYCILGITPVEIKDKQ